MPNPFKAAGRGLKRAFGGGKPERTFSNQVTSRPSDMRSAELVSPQLDEPPPSATTGPLEGDAVGYPTPFKAAVRQDRPLGHPAPVWKIRGTEVTRPEGQAAPPASKSPTWKMRGKETTKPGGTPSTAAKDAEPFSWVDPAWDAQEHKAAVREDRPGGTAPVAKQAPSGDDALLKDKANTAKRMIGQPRYDYNDEPYEREQERIARSNAAGKARLASMKRMNAATEYGKRGKQPYRRMPMMTPAVSHQPIPQRLRGSFSSAKVG